MRSPFAFSRNLRYPHILTVTAWLLYAGNLLLPAAEINRAHAQEMSPGPQNAGVQSPAPSPQASDSSAPQQPAPESPQADSAPPPYDPSIFQKPVPSDQLTFLNNFAGQSALMIIKDKQYKKLVHATMPDSLYHLGTDWSVPDALDYVFGGMPQPVQIRDARYVMISGRAGTNLKGRGFMWIDMQQGIALAGIFFYPTNGEPSPTLTIFSKQVKEKSLEMSQLPQAFAEDLDQWAVTFGVKRVATRYFITGNNEKILLAHDEDYCTPAPAYSAPDEDTCEQLNADAADIDMTGAYYLEQTNHITNATERTITGDEQVAWIEVRDNTCRADADPLRCHIRMTRDHTRVIVHRSPPPHLGRD